MQSREFAIGISRAAAGALLFSLPMLLTMELWWMGFTIEPFRTALLLVLMIPILVGLAYYSGFEKQVGLKGSIVDAFVAYAVGTIVCAVVLSILAILRPHQMQLDEIVGKIILQTIAASFGAVLASSQLGGEQSQEDKQPPDERGQSPANPHHHSACYARELLLMLAGSIFLSLNVAPTEEVLLISLKMTAEHGLILLMLSLVVMHGFVFTVKFHGYKKPPDEHSVTSVFFRFTVPGYAIALLVSLFFLWLFGRLEHTALDETLMAATVLSLPAGVGAASARLIM